MQHSVCFGVRQKKMHQKSSNKNYRNNNKILKISIGSRCSDPKYTIYIYIYIYINVASRAGQEERWSRIRHFILMWVFLSFKWLIRTKVSYLLFIEIGPILNKNAAAAEAAAMSSVVDVRPSQVILADRLRLLLLLLLADNIVDRIQRDKYNNTFVSLPFGFILTFPTESRLKEKSGSGISTRKKKSESLERSPVVFQSTESVAYLKHLQSHGWILSWFLKTRLLLERRKPGRSSEGGKKVSLPCVYIVVRPW